MHGLLNVKYMNSCIGNNVNVIDTIAAALCNFNPYPANVENRVSF
jgi:hypothetical protein